MSGTDFQLLHCSVSHLCSLAIVTVSVLWHQLGGWGSPVTLSSLVYCLRGWAYGLEGWVCIPWPARTIVIGLIIGLHTSLGETTVVSVALVLYG